MSFQNMGCKPSSYAIRSGLVSILSRLIHTLLIGEDNLSKLSPLGKEQFVVGVVSAVVSYSKNQPILKHVLSGISVDLISESEFYISQIMPCTYYY